MRSRASGSLQFAGLILLVVHVNEPTSSIQYDQTFTADRHPAFMVSQE